MMIILIITIMARRNQSRKHIIHYFPQVVHMMSMICTNKIDKYFRDLSSLQDKARKLVGLLRKHAPKMELVTLTNMQDELFAIELELAFREFGYPDDRLQIYWPPLGE